MTTRILPLLGCAFLALSALTLSAQSNTAPAGYFTITLAGGAVGSPSLSVVSFPLQGTATASGQMVGLVTGVTPTTITNSGAAWTASQLSTAATPYLIQFTSGTAAGRTFLLSTTTANTATTVTIDATEAVNVDLTQLGIVAGTDTYQIIPADTISSVFGTPATTGITGATASASSDQIQLFNGTVWLAYYFNTTSNAWLRVGPPINSNNVVIKPDSAALYTRVGSGPVNLVMLGTAPTVSRQAGMNNSGVTFLANNWPVNLTLATSNIQNTAGWVKNTSSSLADTLQVFNGTVWLAYFHNGTNWQRVGPAINSDAVSFPAGSAVVIAKKGTANGQSILSETLPYSLN